MNLELGKRPALSENRYMFKLADGTHLNYFVTVDPIKGEYGTRYKLSDYAEEPLRVLPHCSETSTGRCRSTMRTGYCWMSRRIFGRSRSVVMAGSWPRWVDLHKFMKIG